VVHVFMHGGCALKNGSSHHPWVKVGGNSLTVADKINKLAEYQEDAQEGEARGDSGGADAVE